MREKDKKGEDNKWDEQQQKRGAYSRVYSSMAQDV